MKMDKLTVQDRINISQFRLAAELTQSIMRLSSALRKDPSVNEATRAVAEEVFNSVDDMLEQLKQISEEFEGK